MDTRIFNSVVPCAFHVSANSVSCSYNLNSLMQRHSRISYPCYML